MLIGLSRSHQEQIMSNLWTKTPFAAHYLGVTKKENGQCTLPFSIGGATQLGLAHKHRQFNNQDALSLVIEDALIVGVACDGCAGTDGRLQNIFSNNEVGAKLLSQFVARAVVMFMREEPFHARPGFLDVLQEHFISQFCTFVTCCFGSDSLTTDLFIRDCLLTTVLGFIVTPENYLVFSCGDGVIGINGKFTILEQTGVYLSACLLRRLRPDCYPVGRAEASLREFAAGKTSDLQSIFVATDGFGEALHHEPAIFADFAATTVASEPGLAFILPEFRKGVLERLRSKNNLDSWPSDDASFLLLRRIAEQNCHEVQIVDQGNNEETAC